MELLFPLEHPVAGWRPLLIYINYFSPQGWLQIQSYWANAHINKNLEVWFMAISSAVEVYTILQRHLDTLLIISIMYLKRQSVDSRLKISLIKAINLGEVLLIGLEKREFPQSKEEPEWKDVGLLVEGTKRGDSSVSIKSIRPGSWARLKKLPDVLVFVLAVHRWFPLLPGMICCPLNRTIITWCPADKADSSWIIQASNHFSRQAKTNFKD